MRRKWKSSVKSVWILLGIMLGMECFSSTRDPFALQMWSVRFAVVNYRAQEGKWPTSLDELTGPSYRFQKEDLIDPWGEPFGFECGGPEDDCIVWSTGPDKKLGTADDIVMGSSAMANRWRAKHGLPVVTNAVQQVRVLTAEEQARQFEESQREMERIVQEWEESREAHRKAHRSWLNTVKTVTALVICFYIAFYFMLKKLKRGVMRRVLIVFAIALGILTLLWCADIAYWAWKAYVRHKSHYG